MEVPAILLGMNFGPLVVTGGFNFKYDGNGLVDPATSKHGPDHVSAGLSFGASYMVYNTYPMALGPLVQYSMSVAPGSVFDQQTVYGGMEFFFAPFPVPLLLGATLLVRMTFVTEEKPVIDFFTPGLLFAYKIY
jgi:hypothetical protein